MIDKESSPSTVLIVSSLETFVINFNFQFFWSASLVSYRFLVLNESSLTSHEIPINWVRLRDIC